jgi:hypothetical protein
MEQQDAEESLSKRLKTITADNSGNNKEPEDSNQK